MSTKFVTVRLNFEKEQHVKAWEVLQHMSKEENASYSGNYSFYASIYYCSFLARINNFMGVVI